jgi:hypothetical protein
VSDQRADIAISFSIYGETFKYEGSINWSPNDEGIDERIVGFFSNSYQIGYQKYQMRLEDYFRETDERGQREAELAELKRLKLKYERQAAPIANKPFQVPFSVSESLPQTEQPQPSKQVPEKPD